MFDKSTFINHILHILSHISQEKTILYGQNGQNSGQNGQKNGQKLWSKF